MQSNAVPVPGSGINQLETFAIRACLRGAMSGDLGLRHNGAAGCLIFNQIIVQILRQRRKRLIDHDYFDFLRCQKRGRSENDRPQTYIL
jgi:hypothetical protein